MMLLMTKFIQVDEVDDGRLLDNCVRTNNDGEDFSPLTARLENCKFLFPYSETAISNCSSADKIYKAIKKGLVSDEQFLSEDSDDDFCCESSSSEEEEDEYSDDEDDEEECPPHLLESSFKRDRYEYEYDSEDDIENFTSCKMRKLY